MPNGPPILGSMSPSETLGENPDPNVIKQGGYRPTMDPGPVPQSLVRPASSVEAELAGGDAEIEPVYLEPIDQGVVKALAHETRVEILRILNEREASPRQLAKLLDQSLTQVGYHVKWLSDSEVIQLARTEPRRGAVEHYYRAKPIGSLARVLGVMSAEESPAQQGPAAE